jgi:hypothetical protein
MAPRRASRIYTSFNDEITVEIARISASNLIVPEYECENDSEPVGFADMYLKKLYTYWQRIEMKRVSLNEKRQELMDSANNAQGKQRVQLYRRICALDAPIIAATYEAASLEQHFFAEAYRRIPELYRLDHPMLGSDWGFYGEAILFELPEGWNELIVNELDQQYRH